MPRRRALPKAEGNPGENIFAVAKVVAGAADSKAYWF